MLCTKDASYTRIISLVSKNLQEDSDDTVNGEIDVTATGSDLTDVRLLVQELSCDVTTA